MKNETNCPKCNSENIYADGNLWICPECSNEWSTQAVAETVAEKADDGFTRDAYGTVLNDGDTVAVIKDLKVNGSSTVIKNGTKAKNIRIVDGDDGHDISCKIDGFGSMNLKSKVVKKV